MPTVITVNGRTYTKFWALWPCRSSSGRLIWFDYYYMRPDRNGHGVILTRDDLLRETSAGH